MSAPLRVGLSATVLYHRASLRGMDGIGAYTRAMLRYLGQAPGITVLPMVMGPIARRHLPAGVTRYPGPARLAAGLSVVRWPLYTGEVGLRAPVDVFFSTDHRVPHASTIPVCATVHDAIPLSHPEWANPRLRRTKNLLLRRAMRGADHVIAISHAMLPDLVEHYGIARAHITVIPHGVDAEWFERHSAAELEAIRARHALGARYFLFVGTLQPRKNVERILLAYASLPRQIRDEYQLVVVGKVGWSAGDLVADLRKQAGAGRVRWLARVPDADLRPLYQAASAFVFPSLYEGFGLPVLEAFASGVPVVTSNVTALPEVSGGAALEVDPLRVEAIADAMRQVAEDSALAAALRARGIARAREFSWERSAARTAAVLRAMR